MPTQSTSTFEPRMADIPLSPEAKITVERRGSPCLPRQVGMLSYG